MRTPEESGSIVGQFGSKLAAARRRRDLKLPPYPHDNDILRWRGEAENPLPALFIVGRWVTLDEVQEVYGLKTRNAANMVFVNLRSRGFCYDTDGEGGRRITHIPQFQEPSAEPVFIRDRVISEIGIQTEITGDELRAKLPDLNEKQIRGAVDSFRACDDDETIEGQYQHGFKVAQKRPSR